MEINQYTLSAESDNLILDINPENPYFEVKKIVVKLDESDYGIGDFADLEINLFYKGEATKAKKISIAKDFGSSFNNLEKKVDIYNDPSIHSIKIKLVPVSQNKKMDVHLFIQQGRSLIDIQNPIETFTAHLKNRGNIKILFSAPFGQGKSTFLNHFFKERESDYEVFKVFPVNYSVASNEDIFRYIKTDILFQLLGKGLSFDKEEISLLCASQEYLFLDPKKSIITFIKAAMSLNSQTQKLVDVVEKLNPILNEIKSYQAENQIDDQKKAKEYIEEIYEKEGSLFEDNFYSQLIRQLITQIKETNKETVLIIEDLDRMDPDHIFRILNVISAHYDTSVNGEDEHHNKFGFDKIILVCDKNNIQHIFHHKYGLNTDFNGYFNKYFSSTPFYYDNLKTILFQVENFDNYTNENQIKHIRYFYLKNILQIFIKSEQITLRELLKLKKLNFFKSYKNQHDETNHFQFFLTSRVIYFLLKIYDYNELINKTKKCKEMQIQIPEHFILLCSQNLLAALNIKPNEAYIDCVFNNYSYHLPIQYDENMEYLFVKSDEMEFTPKKPVSSSENPTAFTLDNFYELLIENIKKHEQLFNSESLSLA